MSRHTSTSQVCDVCGRVETWAEGPDGNLDDDGRAAAIRVAGWFVASVRLAKYGDAKSSASALVSNRSVEVCSRACAAAALLRAADEVTKAVQS